MSHRPQKRRRGVELKPFAATNASDFRIPTAPRLWLPGALRWLGRRDDPGLIIARKVAALAASTDDGSFDARGVLLAMEGVSNSALLNQCFNLELLCDPQYVQLEPTRQVTVNRRETDSERTVPSWNLARRLAVEAATSEAAQARVGTPLRKEDRFQLPQAALLVAKVLGWGPTAAETEGRGILTHRRGTPL
ncbi:hypothetical protein FOL46_005452 [Perkinsus olseni]|uniref:Uncharacterized protein n=1 Tax=Perkinsus olseni TaxID=32597 RepID=A0A7J6MSA7_PEROL|nr:hypothetical protein FOL46_005452 [Perkinsus olseni]